MKRGLKEMAQLLCTQHGLSKADAEIFVQNMVDVLNDGLHYEKLVKIKGLGTFKLTSVAPRKSVDVNTGEPIVIEGRDKITFTPDTSMRDLVNRPFGQFETVVVNEGVDFTEIDSQYANGLPENNDFIGKSNVSEDETEKDSTTAMVESIDQESIVTSDEEQAEVNDSNNHSETPLKNDSFRLTAEELNQLNSETHQQSPEKKHVSEGEALSVSNTHLPHSVVEDSASTQADGQNEGENAHQGPVEQVSDEQQDVYVEPLLHSEVTKQASEENIETDSSTTDQSQSEPDDGPLQSNETVFTYNERPKPDKPMKSEKTSGPIHLYDRDNTDYETKVQMQLLSSEVKHNHKMIKSLIVVLALLIIIAFGGVFFMLSQLTKKEARIAHLEASTQWVKEGPQALQGMDNQTATRSTEANGQKANGSKSSENASGADKNNKTQMTASGQQSNAQTPASAKGQHSSQQVTPETANKSTTKQKPSADELIQKKLQAKYDKDPRIRTGAYRITGIARTVVVRPGQTLYSLSRATLGPGMECYIEAVNGGRTEFSAGDKINIPALKHK